MTRDEITAFYADYAACLDEARWSEWPDFFTDDCLYLLQARENFERGLPLATLRFESKAMLQDRVFAITETLFHQPYYQRHVIGPLGIKQHADLVEVKASYAVYRTKPSSVSEVFNVGAYRDELVRDAQGALKFKAKRCIFDSELILNSIIYPL
jgi:salicylate 5-hydroxylase small subunit